MSVFWLHDDPYLTPVAPVAAGAVHPCPHTSATEHASAKPLAELQHHGSVCRPGGGSNSDTMLLYDAGADIIHKRRGTTVDLGTDHSLGPHVGIAPEFNVNNTSRTVPALWMCDQTGAMSVSQLVRSWS